MICHMVCKEKISITSEYFKGANGIICVYNFANYKSFVMIKDFI